MTRMAGNFDLSCSCCGSAPHLPFHGLTSRRGLMAAGLATGAAIAGSAVLPRRAWAQTTMSPDAALQALLDGNKRFVDKKLTSFDADLAGFHAGADVFRAGPEGGLEAAFPGERGNYATAGGVSEKAQCFVEVGLAGAVGAGDHIQGAQWQHHVADGAVVGDGEGLEHSAVLCGRRG